MIAKESLLDLSLEYPKTLPTAIRGIHQFLIKTCHYDEHAPPGMFQDYEQHLAWAEREGDMLLIQWMFFSLYAHFPEVREFVHRVEKDVRGANIPDEHLAQVHRFVKAVVKDAQNHNFKVSNVVGILEEVRRMMSLGVAARWQVVLGFPGFDDKAFIDTQSRESSCPPRYLSMHSAWSNRTNNIREMLVGFRQRNPAKLEEFFRTSERMYPLLGLMHFHVGWKRKRYREAVQEAVENDEREQREDQAYH